MTTNADIRALATLGKTVLREVSEALERPDDDLPVLVVAASILQSLSAYHLTHRVQLETIPNGQDPLAEPPPMDVLPDTPIVPT